MPQAVTWAQPLARLSLTASTSAPRLLVVPHSRSSVAAVRVLVTSRTDTHPPLLTRTMRTLGSSRCQARQAAAHARHLPVIKALANISTAWATSTTPPASTISLEVTLLRLPRQLSRAVSRPVTGKLVVLASLGFATMVRARVTSRDPKATCSLLRWRTLLSRWASWALKTLLPVLDQQAWLSVRYRVSLTLPQS